MTHCVTLLHAVEGEIQWADSARLIQLKTVLMNRG